jgi:ABC-type phosphate/phosphonate transport system permease subunit
MPDQESNPYRSPSVAEGVQRPGRIRRVASWIAWPLVFNVVALVGITATRSAFAQHFLDSELELPTSTKIAVGLIPPALLTALLVARGIGYMASKGQLPGNSWEMVEVILVGTVTGHYALSLCLVEVTVLRFVS